MKLYGERLLCISTTIEDAQPLIPAFNGDQQFNQWCGHTSDLTFEHVQKDMQDTFKLPMGMVWSIVDQAGTLIGVAKTALLPSLDSGWIDLLIIQQSFQGRGYGSEVAHLLETYLFSYPGVRQIEIAILVQNRPAIKFWEKRGYMRGRHYIDLEGDHVSSYLLDRST